MNPYFRPEIFAARRATRLSGLIAERTASWLQQLEGLSDVCFPRVDSMTLDSIVALAINAGSFSAMAALCKIADGVLGDTSLCVFPPARDISFQKIRVSELVAYSLSLWWFLKNRKNVDSGSICVTPAHKLSWAFSERNTDISEHQFCRAGFSILVDIDGGSLSAKDCNRVIGAISERHNKQKPTLILARREQDEFFESISSQLATFLAASCMRFRIPDTSISIPQQLYEPSQEVGEQISLESIRKDLCIVATDPEYYEDAIDRVALLECRLKEIMSIPPAGSWEAQNLSLYEIAIENRTRIADLCKKILSEKFSFMSPQES